MITTTNALVFAGLPMYKTDNNKNETHIFTFKRTIVHVLACNTHIHWCISLLLSFCVICVILCYFNCNDLL